MLLAQSGAVDIDQSVNLYLDSWKLPENEFTAGHEVTVRELLSHTGGTTVSGFEGYQRGQPIPSLIEILDGSPPANNEPVRVAAVPGTAFSYSGGGFEVLHLLIEDVTGLAYPHYLQEHLFTRLRMRSSTYEQPAETEAAAGYDGHGSMIPGKWNVYPEFAAAGLWTTPADLARFALSVQSAAQGDTREVLSPAAVAAMLTPQAVVSGDMQQGLGFQVEGSVFKHSGGNNGFRTQLSVYRDRGQGAIIMTNSDNGQALIGEILRAISQVYGWPDYKPTVAELVTVPDYVLATYVGSYQDAAGKVYQVALSGTDITLTSVTESSVAYPLFAVAWDRFLQSAFQEVGEVRFMTDSQGAVTGFEYFIKQGGLEISAARM